MRFLLYSSVVYSAAATICKQLDGAIEVGDAWEWDVGTDEGGFDGTGGYIDPLMCAPYLKPGAFYYNPDRLSFGEGGGGRDPDGWEGKGSLAFNLFGATLKQVMTSTCYSNTMQMVCAGMYKECAEVVDPSTGNATRVPALMCESECARHMDRWEECKAGIDDNADAVKLFNERMAEQAATFQEVWARVQKTVLPVVEDWAPFRHLECDASARRDEVADEDSVISYVFGRWYVTDDEMADENYHPKTGYAKMDESWEFPPGMDTARMYPEESSKYVRPEDDQEFDVPCYNLGEEYVPDTFDCTKNGLLQYVNNPDDTAFPQCIKPCPVPAFDDGEYDTMYLVYLIPSCAGLILNIFMILTWVLQGRKKFEAVPFQLKASVFLGLAFGLFDTVLVGALKFDLPCASDCDNELCAGEGVACAINRSTQYLLLGILMNLAGLTVKLWAMITSKTEKNSQWKVLDGACVLVPLCLCVLGYAFEGDNMTTATDNGLLNVARHAFTCSMRFETMAQEWGLVWVHFVWAGGVVVLFSALSMLEMNRLQRKINTQNSSSDAEKNIMDQKMRLLKIALMTAILLVSNTIVTVTISAPLEDWSADDSQLVFCELYETWNTHNLPAYSKYFQAGDKVCTLAEQSFSGSNCAHWDPNDHSNADFLKAMEEIEGYTMPDPAVPQDRDCYYWPEWEKTETDEEGNTNTLPGGEPNKLVCPNGNPNEDGEHVNVDSGNTLCACPCNTMVEVNKPSLSQMCLALFAQAAVSCVVGLNIGLKKGNLDLWRTFFQKYTRTSKSESKNKEINVVAGSYGNASSA